MWLFPLLLSTGWAGMGWGHKDGRLRLVWMASTLLMMPVSSFVFFLVCCAQSPTLLRIKRGEQSALSARAARSAQKKPKKTVASPADSFKVAMPAPQQQHIAAAFECEGQLIVRANTERAIIVPV